MRFTTSPCLTSDSFDGADVLGRGGVDGGGGGWIVDGSGSSDEGEGGGAGGELAVVLGGVDGFGELGAWDGTEGTTDRVVDTDDGAGPDDISVGGTRQGDSSSLLDAVFWLRFVAAPIAATMARAATTTPTATKTRAGKRRRRLWRAPMPDLVPSFFPHSNAPLEELDYAISGTVASRS